MHGPTTGATPRGATPPPSPHRATHEGFDPEQYELVATYDMDFDTRAFAAEARGLTWAADVPHGNRCSHCGAHLRYAAVLKHTSGEHITVGETCLGDRFAGSKRAFERTREMGKQRRDETRAAMLWMSEAEREAAYDEFGMRPFRKRIEVLAAQRAQMLAEHPHLACVTYPEMFGDEPRMDDLSRSLGRQLDDRSTLSDRQIEFFDSLYLGGVAELNSRLREQERKQEAVAAGFAAPRGEGVEVTGTVSVIREIANPYAYNATVTKMTVMLPGGAKVYITRPESLREAEVGDAVRFTANFEPARDDDPMFAIGKRPRKAVVVDAEF